MKRFFILIMIAIACVITMSFVACKSAQTDVSIESKLEYGFEFDSDCEIRPDFCAYKADSIKFNINNVKIMVYFGGIFSPEINNELENVRNIPEFKIYFADEVGQEKYLIKLIQENYVSEKYRVKYDFDKNGNLSVLEYNHSEEVLIPEELFNREKGELVLCIGGINVNEEPNRFEILCDARIYYQKDESMVTLSSHKL